MAVDKLVDSTQLDTDLTSVANAIRTKGGTSAQLEFPSGFVSAINDISGGSADYEMGFVTPASNAETLTIPVTQLYNRFLICRFQLKADWTYATNSGGANVFTAGVFGSNKYFACGTNSSGNGPWFFDRTPSFKGDKIAFSSNQITVKVLGNGAISGFSSGSTYVWLAWNEV